MKNDSKKIKIILQILPRPIGGIETFLFDLFKYSDKDRIEFLFVSFDDGPTVRTLKNLGAKVKILDFKNASNLKNLVKLLKKEKPDITQTNHFYPGLAIASARLGIKHIWLVEGAVKTSFANKGKKRHEIILDFIGNMSDLIICPSKFLKKQFNRKIQKKIFIIPNALDVERARSVSGEYALKKRQTGQNVITIGMIAHLHPQKRHIDFIHAAKKICKKFHNTKFIIIGSPYNNIMGRSYYRYLKKEAKELIMKRRLTFLGFQKDIIGAMAKIDIVVLPSINEGFGNVILEAMALGKPVVVSDSGAPKELVRNGVNGRIFKEKNINSLASAMEDLVNNKEKRKLMGASGKKITRRLFDIKKISRCYENIWQRLAG